MIYSYYINLDERGEFYADVRDHAENTVFEIHGFDIFDDGYMRHKDDLNGLREYCAELGVMELTDNILPARQNFLRN